MVRFLLLGWLWVVAGVTPGEPFQTVAESSGYARATTYEQAREMLGVLGESPLVDVASIGKSGEGRELAIAVIADPPVTFSADAPRGVGERLVVLLFGSIHGGEVCGTEALLMLARDLVAAREAGGGELLDHLVICVVPVYNADGHARTAAGNRPGQNGPEETGTRGNASGLDLNRDWVKMDAPETRAMVGFLNAWDPAVIVDTHTTNGSNHRFTMTYQGPKHPAGDRAVVEYVRDVMLAEVDRRFEERTGYHAFFYGNFGEGHTKWTTYPAEPWYGVSYRGLRNRVSILTEAYAYASFEDRVKSTAEFCREVLRFAAEERAEIKALITAADERTAEAGRIGAKLAVKTEARAFPEPAVVLGYDEPARSGAHGERSKIDQKTAAHRTYTIPLINDWVATEQVHRPGGYLVPGWCTEITDRLAAHGIQTRPVPPGPVREVEAGIYRIESVERSEREWEGRVRMNLGVRLEHGSVEIKPGDVIVRTDSPLGALAAYMLEPRATGGLAAWGFLPKLEAGRAYPVARLDSAAVESLCE